MPETIESLSEQKIEDLEERVSVPYRVENVTLISPGEWNDLVWTETAIENAVNETEFMNEDEPRNAALYLDHKDRQVDAYAGRVENVRMRNGEAVGDLVVTDKQTAMHLEFGAQFGISPKADGFVDDSQEMEDFTFENFSVVINPAVKTTWLNEEAEELSDVEVHAPAYKNTTDDEFESSNLTDFVGHSNYEQLSDQEKLAVSKHFLASSSGFPAEEYTDLSLQVVEPDGELNKNALQQAKARANQVADIDQNEVKFAKSVINNLAQSAFPESDYDKVTMEMMDYEIHEPEFSGTTEQEWNRPDLEDFDVSEDTYSELPADEKEMVEAKFVASSSGFPAENFSDLSLPVVEPSGELSLNALSNAKARANQVEGMSEDNVIEVKEMMTELANENFESASFDPVEMAEDMPVGEDDWVQWNPEEAIEAHGKVIRVIEPNSEDEQLQVDVRMYIQDDDGVWHPTGDVRRKDMDEVGPWGNTPSEDAISDERLEDVKNASPVRKFDPDDDPEDISESIRKAIENDDVEELISDSQEEAIERKVEEHNEKHGDEEGKKVTKDMLIEVYERGMGAYQDTHRPGMSPQQWSMARVNAFLYLVRNGNPENDAYVQDNDLLPEGHPKKGETENSEQMNVDVYHQESELAVQVPKHAEDQILADENYVPMTEADEAEQESVPEEEHSEDNEDSFDVEALKQEVVEEVADELKAELEDDEEDEEVEDEDVDEAEEPVEDLDDFEEFRSENPELSLSEAAERFEEESRDVEDKLEEMADKIDSLEDQLSEREDEVEELSERVNDPQVASQASGDEAKSAEDRVSELSDEELTERFADQFIGPDGVSLEGGAQ
jgi:hypothetical protein